MSNEGHWFKRNPNGGTVYERPEQTFVNQQATDIVRAFIVQCAGYDAGDLMTVQAEELVGLLHAGDVLKLREEGQDVTPQKSGSAPSSDNPAADPVDELLGIDHANPLHHLAGRLVEADNSLMTTLREHRLLRTTLSVTEVARRMATTPSAVMALELPGADPKLSTVRRYALAIGVMVEHRVSPPSSVDEGNPDDGC